MKVFSILFFYEYLIINYPIDWNSSLYFLIIFKECKMLNYIYNEISVNCKLELSHKINPKSI